MQVYRDLRVLTARPTQEEEATVPHRLYGHVDAAVNFSAVFLEPGRDEFYARIDGRFDAMLQAGALDEVAALAGRRLDPLLPAMKAHGVPALIRHLDDELTLQQAAAIGRADTRHYAK